MGGEGKTWQRWELYRPRRTAGLYPLSSLSPHYLVLWNEHYTSRWRTVEEYPRYFSFSLSLEIPSTFFFLFLLSFLFFVFFHSVLFSLLSLFSFLRVPLPPILTSRFVFCVFFFLSLLFIVLHFFLYSFLAYTPILDSGVSFIGRKKRRNEE